MKRYSVKLLSALFFLSFAISACEKDEEPDRASNTVLISQSSWRFGAATAGGVDVSSSFQACQKDNVLSFTATGGGQLDEGPTKCNAADVQTKTFTWTFNATETEITISTVLFTGGSNTFTIVALNESQLVVSQPVTIGSSTSTAIVTFLH